MTRGDEIVRGQSLAALFARGDLDEVLAHHLRRPARGADDRAAVVGAYAWSGRLDEAQAQHDVFASRAAEPAYLEVARCYLVIGLCHAGRLGAARRLARRSAAEPLAAASPLWFYRRYARAFIAYFAGRMERCRRAARHALRVAVAGGNAFGQLLANDLLAHAMFHLGRARDGQRLLANATHLSAELNLATNYLNVMVASRVFAVTTHPADEAAAAALVALLRHGELRYFARRHGHAALSIAACLRGDLAGAREQMQLAAAAAVGDDARAGVRLSATQACLAAVSGDRAGAGERFGRALALALRRRHIDLFAETAFLRRLLLGTALGAGEISPAAARSDIARLAWARGDAPDAAIAADPAAHGDQLLALARELAGAPPLRWVDAGLAGLAAATLPPGKIIGVADGGVVIRSDTAVTHVRAVSDVTARLLSCLARGPQTKARLVRELWGLHTYHPRLHDGTLYTAVSRLRRAWGAQGAWLEKTLDGYQLQAGVTVVALAGAAAGTVVPGVAAPTLPERLVAASAQRGGVTCAEAAQVCGVSASTALRALRQLVADGRMERVGSGSGTKYAPGRDVQGA